MLIILLLSFCLPICAFGEQIHETPSTNNKHNYSIFGEVIDKQTRLPIEGCVIKINNPKDLQNYTQSNDQGKFELKNLKGGSYRIEAIMLGYSIQISEEIIIPSSNLYLKIELEQQSENIKELIIKSSPEPFKPIASAPLSRMVIESAQIEKSAGGNRDISKIITVLPGVATPPPSGYRNDYTVRGGAPGENKFYIDGIEIPTINHFSTQGAGGGPVGLLNADFIRKVDFYTASFPIEKSNALSSVMDITLRDGNPIKNSYKFAIGASEFSLASDGHLINTKGKSNLLYTISVRHSYLQFLFKLLQLPFLPTITDAQLKLKYRINHNNELSLLFLGGLDNMKLNIDGVKDEQGEYIISYLPVIKQRVYTIGLSYKHYYKGNNLALYLSYNYFKNGGEKYKNNDNTLPDNLNLNYNSTEAQTLLRAENTLKTGKFNILTGLSLNLPNYSNSTYQKLYLADALKEINYNTQLNLIGYAAYIRADYISKNNKLTLSAGLRIDGNSYNNSMQNPLKQLSPRIALSYEILPKTKIKFGAGRYFQLPAYTVMGYKVKEELANKNQLKYLGVNQISFGIEYQPKHNIQILIEPFYKNYFNALYSSIDNIPLTSGATEYGAYGNTLATSDLSTNAYGIELSARLYIEDKFSLIGAYTYFRSTFKSKKETQNNSLPWDNRHLLTLDARYQFPKNYSLGAKYRLSGGTPYTPYDAQKSSLVSAWDASGSPYYNYNQYCAERLPIFWQLDLRADKTFYFNKWSLDIYIDLQNILNIKYKYPDIYLSTGKIEDPSLPKDEQRYKMKYITNQSGTIIPTIGVIVSL